MIITIPNYKRNDFFDYIDQMHKIRKQVFNDKLQWEVNCNKEWEIDYFDELDPLYVLCVEGDKVLGSLRLLPTTGPNMLSDIFAGPLEFDDDVASPTIWESSRFCISPDVINNDRADNMTNLITAELLLGLFKVGLINGLEFIVSVYSIYIKRVLNRINCKEEIIAGPKRIGNVPTYAGLFEVSNEMLRGISTKSGLSEPVIIDGNEIHNQYRKAI